MSPAAAGQVIPLTVVTCVLSYKLRREVTRSNMREMKQEFSVPVTHILGPACCGSAQAAVCLGHALPRAELQ